MNTDEIGVVEDLRDRVEKLSIEVRNVLRALSARLQAAENTPAVQPTDVGPPQGNAAMTDPTNVVGRKTRK